jgi:tetratricopeptide (TPR) repeat protein
VPRWRRIGALSVLLLGTATAVTADYRQRYLDGRKALRAGDYEAALVALQAAVAEDDSERAKARLVGVIPEPYLPHHYLGLAHFGARRCDEALAAWKRSNAQGVIAALPVERDEARRLSGHCEALARAEAAVEGARGAASRAVDPPVTAISELHLATQLIARVRLSWDFSRIADAEEAALRATSAIEAWVVAHQEPPAPVDLAQTTHSQPAGSPALGAATASSEAPGAVSDRSAASLASADAPTGAAPLPGVLEAAMQSYFAGDYQAAVDQLRAFSTPPSTRAYFLQRFFRGAALQALYWLGGERDPALAAEAREDWSAAHRARPSFVPTAEDFSPRVVAAYRSTG